MFPKTSDVLAILPQIFVAVLAMFVLLTDAIWPKVSKRVLANVAVLGLVLVSAWVIATWPGREAVPALQNMVLNDRYTAFFNLVILGGTALSIWMSIQFLDREGGQMGEYYALLLFTAVGGMVMGASINLICVFIGLEILSIALYILSGYHTHRLESDEAALKYFLLGSYASAFLLFGIALVYGASESLDIRQISTNLGNLAVGGADPSKNYLLLAGIALMLVGFGFKVAAVPFHIWTPDVYQGAPTSVTAFMSVVAKAAGFAAFLRVIATSFQDPNLQLQISAVLASVAALTMLVGNVVACVQTNLKRILAYSSIAHAGYITAGLVAAVRGGGMSMLGDDPRQSAIAAVLFYAAGYTVSNLGAFGVLLALRKRGEEVQDLKDLAGVGFRHPWLAALLTLFLLSLAGLPPFVGFFGKLFLIQALIEMSSPLVWLIVLFVLTSVVSFYYYLGPVRAMYMPTPEEDEGAVTTVTADGHLKLALAVAAIGTVLLGLWAGGVFGVAQRVAESFFTSGIANTMP
ncbi:MAG: NADH-quinone oxidoreductase subunit N [Armatimonadota bacterium]